jgi:hypothetical protein
VQYRADNSNAGRVMDAVRSQLPSDAQAWMKDSALIPSAQRGAASTQKIIDTGAGIASYIKTNTPGQVAGDVKAVISKNWDALKADHAKAAAQGPEAEARWRGNITGRAVFEIAAVFVPVTKAAQLAKLDKLADAAKVAGKLDDVADAAKAAKAAKAAGGKIDDLLVSAKRILGDIPLTSKSLDDLYQAGKLSMDQARSLAKSVEWKNKDGGWIYPPNEGFDKAPFLKTVKKGDQLLIDRYGHAGGKFTSPLGESYAGRALAPNTNKMDCHVYKVADDIDVLSGKATPWFDEAGGATQYKFSRSIADLIYNEKLIELRR